jgi:hypothetical protein
MDTLNEILYAWAGGCGHATLDTHSCVVIGWCRRCAIWYWGLIGRFCWSEDYGADVECSWTSWMARGWKILVAYPNSLLLFFLFFNVDAVKLCRLCQVILQNYPSFNWSPLTLPVSKSLVFLHNHYRKHKPLIWNFELSNYSFFMCTLMKNTIKTCILEMIYHFKWINQNT